MQWGHGLKSRWGIKSQYSNKHSKFLINEVISAWHSNFAAKFTKMGVFGPKFFWKKIF